MNKKERQKYIHELKEICRKIGCSGVEPDMCQNRPQHCSIIRKLCRSKKEVSSNE